ncbi:HYR-like domain-containing protein, partial [Flavobacterium paronense]
AGLATAQALAPTATDNCGGTVTYTKTASTFTAGSCPNNGTYTNTWVAKDVCNNSSATFTQVITIEDTTAPIFETLPNPSTISYSSTPLFQQAIASDNCSTATLTFNDVPTSTNCDGSYSITRTWTAKDDCNNSSNASQTINVSPAVFIANNDSGNSINGFVGGISFTNVLVNDTLDGNPITSSQVTTTFVSSTNPGVTLSGTNVVVAPGTPAGNYTLTYQICGVKATCSCATAIVTVAVSAASIIANDDTGAAVNGLTGGTAFTNVLVNDT